MDKRFEKTKIASIMGIIGNIFLCIIKGIIGFLTNSRAMIADTFNSAGDIFSSLMTYIGNKIASVPSDDDHNLGHGKAEYIYSLLISIMMLLMASKSFFDSTLTLINHQNFTFSIWLIIVCIITIVVKFFLYLYTHKISKTYKNILIEANSKDHFNDTIITLFSLASCILSMWNIYFVDSIIGMLISLWIGYTGIKIFKDSYDVLMDKSINDEAKEKVYEIIKRHEEIKKVNHFNSAPVGYKYQIKFTIYLDGNMSTFASHEIADRLEDEIEKEIDEVYLTVIHVNPIDLKTLDE